MTLILTEEEAQFYQRCLDGKALVPIPDGVSVDRAIELHKLARTKAPKKPETSYLIDSKTTPIYSGVLAYFPLAIAAVSRVSKYGNDKHNGEGSPLQWTRGLSNRHKDAIATHLTQSGTVDPESGELHDAALAWRALANLQLAEEARIAKTKEEVVED